MTQSGQIEDPIEHLLQAHDAQLELCRRLEQIADDLPGRVNRQHCQDVASYLCGEFALHQADEELGLFPLLQNRCTDMPGLEATLERLKHEHMDDEGFADEIVDALNNLVQGVPQHLPETLAYMLRGFFACRRRHIAFENEVVLPAARRCLGTAGHDALRSVMRANRSEDVTRLFPHTPCVSAKAAIFRALGRPASSA